MISNNSAGQRSVKYGRIAESVQSLEVVLSNGEVIETKRRSKREVNKLMGHSTFEGEIYRSLDALLNDYEELINSYEGTKSGLPYNIFDVRDKKGSVDLTPLFVGSEGTLGVITTATMRTTAYNPEVLQAVVGFSDKAEFFAKQEEIEKCNPAIFMALDTSSIDQFSKHNPLYSQKFFGDKMPEVIALLEWDEFTSRVQKKGFKRLKKVLSKSSVTILDAHNQPDRDDLSKFFRSPTSLLQIEVDLKRPVPGLESATVKKERLTEFLAELTPFFKKQGVAFVSWWYPSSGDVQVFPLLDLRQLGHRQKLMRLIDEYHKFVLSHGGTPGVGGSGRITAQFTKDYLGDGLYEVMIKLKEIFDPYNIMNPGVKVSVDPKIVGKKMSQSGYTLKHFHNYFSR